MNSPDRSAPELYTIIQARLHAGRGSLFWPIRTCGICQTEYGYDFQHGRPYFGACDCPAPPGPPHSWAEVATNYQQRPELRAWWDEPTSPHESPHENTPARPHEKPEALTVLVNGEPVPAQYSTSPAGHPMLTFTPPLTVNPAYGLQIELLNRDQPQP